MLISAQLFSLYGEVEHVNCQCSKGSIHGNCVNANIKPQPLLSFISFLLAIEALCRSCKNFKNIRHWELVIIFWF